MIKSSLSADYVNECLSYDPSTGLLKWKLRPDYHFKSYRSSKIFTSRFVGKVAGWESIDGYTNIKIDNYAYRAHRIAWLIHHGGWPENIIDHINGIKTDNRMENLRDVDRYLSAQNMPKPSNNTTGFIGVAPVSSGKGYRAQIMKNGKMIFIGRFKTIEEAALARVDAERKLGFHENHGR